LKYTPKIIWHSLVDASAVVQLLLIFGGTGAYFLGLWIWLRDLLISILNKRPSQWQIKDLAIVSLIFLMFLSCIILFVYILVKKKSPDTKLSNITNKLPTITDKAKFLEHPTPADIAVRINEQRSPYLLDGIERTFIGLCVHWRQCSFGRVVKHPNKSITTVYFDNNRIISDIDVEEYPIIKSAVRGTDFDIWAEIIEIDWPTIRLRIHMMELHKLSD